MTKYYGVWDKVGDRWWTLFIPEVLDYWISRKNVAKVINGIPLWDNSDFEYGLKISKTWEIREFTPADALLVKCGKIK